LLLKDQCTPTAHLAVGAFLVLYGDVATMTRSQNRQRQKIRHIARHFEEADPRLAAVFSGMALEPLAPFVGSGRAGERALFAALCRDIVGQQLHGSAARAVFGRFAALFPRRVVSARSVCGLSLEALRGVGMSWAKARSVKDLAERVSAGSVRLGALASLPDEAIIGELSRVRGIGRWTAEMFLIFSLGREDVFSHGDLGLRRGLEKVYRFRAEPTRERIEAITRRWSPFRSYGCLALWEVADGENNS
jgi:DNA-3-methyladenine glycosylase II